MLVAAKIAVHLAALTPYGWFRDELYYVACSDRLAWGYVDHPPLSIAVLRVVRAVLGDSLVVVRVVPMLAGAALVALTVRTARAIGGGSVAAAVAGGAVLLAPGFLSFDHLYSMNPLDHLFWAVAARLAVHLACEPADRRAWVGLGLALGLGVTNKWSVLWLAAGLVAGLSATPARRALRSPWPYASAALAIAVAAPHVAWEIAHGWPTLEFMREALAHKYVHTTIGAFFGEVALLANPVGAAVAAFGVALPLLPPANDRDADASLRARPLAIAFVVALAIVASSGSGKAEYVLSALPLAFASGGVAVERLARGRRLARAALGVAAAAAFAFAGIVLPFAVPVLGEEAFLAYAKKLGVRPQTSEKKRLGELPQHYADMHGWEELVATVADVRASLPDDDRARAKIWARTGGYGPAAAVDVLGRSRGLPRAISGHNEYFLWGYGDDDRAVTIVLGGGREGLDDLFEDVTLARTFRCRFCMPYEDDKPIWIARRLRRPWAELWPTLKHYE